MKTFGVGKLRPPASAVKPSNAAVADCAVRFFYFSERQASPLFRQKVRRAAEQMAGRRKKAEP